jgi:hypothetical protein
MTEDTGRNEQALGRSAALRSHTIRDKERKLFHPSTAQTEGVTTSAKLVVKAEALRLRFCDHFTAACLPEARMYESMTVSPIEKFALGVLHVFSHFLSSPGTALVMGRRCRCSVRVGESILG